MTERYAPGQAQRLVEASVGTEWVTMPDLVEGTGLSRNTIRRCLIQGGFEVQLTPQGYLRARRRVAVADWLRRPWTSA